MQRIDTWKLYKPKTQKRSDYITRHIFVDTENRLVIKDLGTAERDHYYYWEGGMKIGIISELELIREWVEIKIDGTSEFSIHERHSHLEIVSSYGTLKNGDKVKYLKCEYAPYKDGSNDADDYICNWTGKWVYNKKGENNEK